MCKDNQITRYRHHPSVCVSWGELRVGVEWACCWLWIWSDSQNFLLNIFITAQQFLNLFETEHLTSSIVSLWIFFSSSFFFRYDRECRSRCIVLLNHNYLKKSEFIYFEIAHFVLLHIKEHELEFDMFMNKTAVDALFGWVKSTVAVFKAVVVSSWLPLTLHPVTVRLLQSSWNGSRLYFCRQLVCKCAS